MDKGALIAGGKVLPCGPCFRVLLKHGLELFRDVNLVRIDDPEDELDLVAWLDPGSPSQRRGNGKKTGTIFHILYGECERCSIERPFHADPARRKSGNHIARNNNNSMNQSMLNLRQWRS